MKQESALTFKLLPFTSLETVRKCLSLKPSIDFPTLFIASYPKSGTTWLQAIIFHLLSTGKGLPLEHISNFSPFYEVDKTWSERDDTITSKYTENHHSLGWRVFNTHFLPTMLPACDNSHMKYIYVIRNGRDVVVSFFHHLSNQVEGGYVGDFNSFLTQWSKGEIIFGSYINHIRCWIKQINSNKDTNNQNILLIRYEDMKNDLSAEIRKMAIFLKQNMTNDRLIELTNILSFQSMKENEKLYQPLSVEWSNNFKFLRKGVVGDSKNNFSEMEEKLIDEMISREFPSGIPEWFTDINVL